MSEPALKLADYELPEPAPADVSKGVWLSLEEASIRIGITVGRLRQRCLDKYGAAGTARKQKTARGAEAWFIHESADPALKVGVRFVEDENAAFDMSRVTAKQRATILFREACVLRFASVRSQAGKLGLDVHKIAGMIAPQLASEHGRPVSPRSIERWYAAYYRGPEGRRGRAGLVDGRLDTTKEDAGDDKFAAFYRIFDRYYLQQGEPKIRTCYRVALAIAPVEGVTEIPSITSVQRHVASIPADQLILARQGEKAHDDHCAVHIRRDYTRIVVPGEDGTPVERELYSDDIWCSDHHIADVMVILGYDKDGKPRIGRPWLTPWQDIRSRRIVGWRWSKQAPDATSVLLAFRDASIRSGMAVPRYAFVDNGKDFDAWFLQGQTKQQRRQKVVHDPNAFKGVFGMLDVGVVHAKPYNAKSKPIERFFGTFTNWCRLLPSYCGSSPDEKPERLAEIIEKGQVPTFETFVEQADAILGAYNMQPHTGHAMDNRTPDVVYDAMRRSIRRVSEAALSICLVKVARPQKVTLRGVRYGDYYYGTGDPNLMQHKGRSVYLFVDPDNVKQVRVFGAGEEYLCTVEAPKLQPWAVVTHDSLKTATADMKRQNRTTKEALRTGMRIHRDPTEALVAQTIAEQQRRGDLPPDAPASVEMVRTGFERAIEHEQINRAAVGAERVYVGGGEIPDEDEDHGSIFGRNRRSLTDEES